MQSPQLLLLCLYGLTVLANLALACPVTVPNCSCEDYRGGHDVWCPSTFNHDFRIHYKPGYMWLNCNPEHNLTIADILYQLRNVSFGSLGVNALTIQSCPTPTTSFDRLIRPLNISATLRELGITFTRPEPGFPNRLIKGQFEGLSGLQKLQLINNYLDEIAPDTFAGLSSLESIALVNNNLETLPAGIFSELTNLNYLGLQEATVKELPEKLLANQKRLTILNLAARSLTKLPADLLFNTTKLQSVQVDYLNMTDIPANLFDRTSELENVTLSGNGFEYAQEGFFAKTKLKRFSWNGLRCIERRLGNNKQECEIKLGALFKNVSTLEVFSMVRATKASVTLDPDLFIDCEKLKDIKLISTGLSTMPEGLFRGQRHKAQIKLNLKLNDLTSLPDDLFLNVLMSIVDLSHNQLTTISNGLFHGQSYLTSLKLNNNNIRNIEERAFFYLRELRGLDLNNNQIYMDNNNMDVRWSSMSRLVELDLVGNNLSMSIIPHDWTTNLLGLRRLNLSDNQIGPNIDAIDLNFKQNNIKIDLRRNRIRQILFDRALTLPDDIDHASDVQSPQLFLDDNPVECNCQALNLAKMARDELNNSAIQSWFALDIDNLSCSSPKAMLNRPFKSLAYDELACAFPSATNRAPCPNNCSCSYTPANKKTYVSCQGMGFEHFPKNLPMISDTDSLTLDMNDNDIVELDDLPDTVDNFPAISDLSLSNNKLEWVKADQLPANLKRLHIDRNMISSFDEETLAFFSKLDLITIGINEFECSCQSKALYNFVLKYMDRIADVNNITIECDGVVQPILELELADFCTDFGDYFLKYLFPPFISIIVLLLIALIFCLFNKERVSIWIYSHPWLRPILCMEELDDLDTLTKDAFISYSNEDRDYVEGSLIPQLEEGKDLKFETIYHTRDFDVGDNITEQINRAVDRSRRTVVVLSKNFTSSPWYEHEFAAAHNRKRVIVIVLGELPSEEEMGPLMWDYIKTNTYLKHDDQFFWQKLYYALPHRGRKYPFLRRKRRFPPSSPIDQLNLIERSPQTRSSATNGRVNPTFVGSQTVYFEQSPPNSAVSPTSNGHATVAVTS